MNEEDHNLLIRIDERTKTLVTSMNNHLKHHFKYHLLAWSLTLTALIGIIITICVK